MKSDRIQNNTVLGWHDVLANPFSNTKCNPSNAHVGTPGGVKQNEACNWGFYISDEAVFEQSGTGI